MKSLAEFARKPQLLEIVLDTAEVIEEFGEAITFYMHDYVDISTYFDFFKASQEGGDALNGILRSLVLDKDGKPCIQPGNALPVSLTVAVLSEINKNLGKSNPKSSMNETGNQPV